jgi:arylsulfatase A-like enzyme
MEHRVVWSRVQSVVLPGLIALSLVLAGCGSGSHQAEPARGPNILVVVLDACRPDKLGCYGFERDTSPAIDELARDPDAVLFRRHHVQGAGTKSSTASLFSGLYVFQHGVVWGHKVREDPDRPGLFPTQLLSESHHTMAERLGELGYDTFGAVKSFHLDPKYGFAQGFDDYYGPDDLRGEWERIAKTQELIEGSDGPFFGYLHLNACHHPFQWYTRDAEYMERYGFDYDEKARMAAGVDFTTAKIMHAINDGEITLEPDDVRFLNLIYEAKVRTVDQRLVAPLIQGLKEMGRYDDTLIILTADHGEELYDHEGYAHSHALWNEIIHVPLIVKFPRGTRPAELAGDVDTPTQSVDLLPSLLAMSGQEADPALPGTDIFTGPSRGSAYAETMREWALVQGDYKLIDGAERRFLCEHPADPKERSNLAKAQPDRVKAMQEAAEALRRFVATKPRHSPLLEMELDPEAVRALRSLGYIR